MAIAFIVVSFTRGNGVVDGLSDGKRPVSESLSQKQVERIEKGRVNNLPPFTIGSCLDDLWSSKKGGGATGKKESAITGNRMSRKQFPEVILFVCCQGQPKDTRSQRGQVNSKP